MRPTDTTEHLASLRVLIVAEHASLRLGGQGALPYHYFRMFRRQGVQTWMLVHDRTRQELAALLPREMDHIHFVTDTVLQQKLSRLSHRFPTRVRELFFGWMTHMVTQWRQREAARRLVQRLGIHVIYQPSPISPMYPSLLFGLGAPVVMGPLGGGMDFPPAFRHMDHPLVRTAVVTSRWLGHLLNCFLPGKLRAATLIIANERTRRALPRGLRGGTARLPVVPDSGVDLAEWPPAPPPPEEGPVRIVFLGRLIDLKGVDLLVEAFARIAPSHPEALLQIAGAGPMRPRLEAQVRAAGLEDRVHFLGWLSRPQATETLLRASIFTLPSLRECGGNALLEAMAMGRPSVVAHWGGPGDYLDDASGIRVPVTSREGFISGLAAALARLVESPELRRRMGQAARQRVSTCFFDWQSKAGRVLEILRQVRSTGVPGSAGVLVRLGARASSPAWYPGAAEDGRAPRCCRAAPMPASGTTSP